MQVTDAQVIRHIFSSPLVMLNKCIPLKSLIGYMQVHVHQKHIMIVEIIK